jgi:DNA-binding MarR family transcriptional regulator
MDLLHKHGVMTVGQLQRRIGVLPAQMSRILRSLERGGEEPYIRCTINPADKRKVNVELTEVGVQAHAIVRKAKLANSVAVMAQLPRDKRQAFVSLLRDIQDLLTGPRPGQKAPAKSQRNGH